MFQPTTTPARIEIDCTAVENPAARQAFEDRFAAVSVLMDLLGTARRLETEAA